MIGERLNALRQTKGLSQQAVAEALHISRGAYGSYETGRRTPPLETLVPMARFYGTTTDYLLGNTDDPAPPIPLDERGRNLLRFFREADPRGQANIYHTALQEKTHYGLASRSPESS